MANEVFTTYTEVDGATYLSQTSARATFASVPRNVDAYLHDDKTAIDMDTDLIYEFEFQITATASSALVGLVGISSALDDLNGLISGGDDWIGLYAYDSAGTLQVIVGQFTGGAGTTTATTATISTSTSYYVRMFRRVSDQYAAGVLVAAIYSDSARTVLVDRIEIQLTARVDYRYVITTQSYNSATAPAMSGWVQNLDLAGAAPIQGLTLLTTYTAAQGPSVQQHIVYNGQFFEAYAYTGDGTTTEALQVAYANPYDMAFGTEHAVPGAPVSKRGYYSGIAARFKQTLDSPVVFTTDAAANVTTPEVVMVAKTNGDLDSSALIDSATTQDRFMWPSVVTDDQNKVILAGRDEGTNTQVIYQRAASGWNLFSSAGWDTKVVVKSGLTAARGIMQVVSYQSGDIGFVIGQDRNGATISYRHGTYVPSTDTYTLETEQTIGTDLGGEYSFRAMPMRNNKLLVVWRKYDSGTPGTYSDLRYNTRTAGSSGTWGTAADAVTDMNGTANTQGWFTGTSNYGKAEEAVVGYYDGTNFVTTVWNGTSWATKSTLVSSPTISGSWISAPITSVGKTAFSWVDTTAGGVQVVSYDLTTTQESTDGILVDIEGDPTVATFVFNTQVTTDPGGSGYSAITWLGADARQWGRLYNHNTSAFVGAAVPVSHQRYADAHNAATSFIDNDGYLYVVSGGRGVTGGGNDEAPVTKKSVYPLTSASRNLREWTDISSSLTYDALAGHRGYKFLYVDKVGTVYSIYLYSTGSGATTSWKVGIQEYRNGTWSAETILAQYTEPAASPYNSRNYVNAISGGLESGSATISTVSAHATTPTITTDAAHGWTTGDIRSHAGTGSAVDGEAYSITVVTSTTYTVSEDTSGGAGTGGTAYEQDSIKMLWSFIHKDWQPPTDLGNVLQNAHYFASIEPQGNGVYVLTKADGTTMTAPMDISTNNDEIYEFRDTLKNIVSTTAANDYVEVTAHGWATNDIVFIDGSTCTPTIDGKRTITKIDNDNITVGVDITTGTGTAGDITPEWEFTRLGGSVGQLDDAGTLRAYVMIPMMEPDSTGDATRQVFRKWDGSAWTEADITTANLTDAPSMGNVWESTQDTLWVVSVSDYSGASEVVTYESGDQGATWGVRVKRSTAGGNSRIPLISPYSEDAVNLVWHQTIDGLHSEVIFDNLVVTFTPRVYTERFGRVVMNGIGRGL